MTLLRPQGIVPVRRPAPRGVMLRLGVVRRFG
jgi:hypothetical protein